MKLLDDPKIPIARRNPRRPHHSHKPLDVAVEMGLKPRRPYCTRHRHHHMCVVPTNLDHKTKKEALKTGGGALPLTRAEIHRTFMIQMPQRRGDLRRCQREARDPIALGVRLGVSYFKLALTCMNGLTTPNPN
jgi:hypothetical protein